jgi:transposase
VSDLFGCELLERLDFPDPWRADVLAAVGLIDDLDREIHAIERELRRLGADHPYVSLLQTVPGIAWVLGYTIAAEIGDIGRFASPKKLCGYTGLCPKVRQSGSMDRRGPLAKTGPKYLRWALMEATTHACQHPVYRDRHQHTKQRGSGSWSRSPLGRPVDRVLVLEAACRETRQVTGEGKQWEIVGDRSRRLGPVLEQSRVVELARSRVCCTPVHSR